MSGWQGIWAQNATSVTFVWRQSKQAEHTFRELGDNSTFCSVLSEAIGGIYWEEKVYILNNQGCACCEVAPRVPQCGRWWQSGLVYFLWGLCLVSSIPGATTNNSFPQLQLLKCCRSCQMPCEWWCLPTPPPFAVACSLQYTRTHTHAPKTSIQYKMIHSFAYSFQMCPWVSCCHLCKLLYKEPLINRILARPGCSHL